MRVLLTDDIRQRLEVPLQLRYLPLLPFEQALTGVPREVYLLLRPVALTFYRVNLDAFIPVWAIGQMERQYLEPLVYDVRVAAPQVRPQPLAVLTAMQFAKKSAVSSAPSMCVLE